MKWLATLLVLVLTVAGCSGPEAVPLAEGEWRAWLASPGGELPFGLVVSSDGEEGKVTIVNGSERIEIPRVQLDDSEIVLGIDHYDSIIVATIGDRGRRLEGRWTKTAGPGKTASLPFEAVAGRHPRFEPDPGEDGGTSRSIDGRWHVEFSTSDEPAVGIFSSGSDGVVEGTFLTTTGDYRYLAGRLDGERLRLSCFDGAHAFLFDARLEMDGTLAGDFWSRDNWHETWVARRDPDAALGDGFDRVRASDAIDLAQVVYPDLDGNSRSLGGPRFDGHARIVYVFGSWCPNCGDATRLMIELDRRYRERGLSIVGVAFELTGDLQRDAEQVRRYADHHGIEYPLLIGGQSDKTAASGAFPLIDRVRAYPTMLFVDHAGAVRAIYSGFSGPATGASHDDLRQRFETLIEELLEAGPAEA